MENVTYNLNLIENYFEHKIFQTELDKRPTQLLSYIQWHWAVIDVKLNNKFLSLFPSNAFSVSLVGFLEWGTERGATV